MSGSQVDFFVSYAGSDRLWAEWVAGQLLRAGYSVELDIWDWDAGQNFVIAMSDALDRCGRVVALFSDAYFDRARYTTHEWTAFVLVGELSAERLVPLRIEDVPARRVPALLRPLITRDLFGLGEERARQVLLEAVAGSRRPGRTPEFPGQAGLGELAGAGEAEPRLPGGEPGVWNVPPRNPSFTGRDRLLAAVRKQLLSGDRAVVQALRGMGGVGKTQLALEYSHRFAGGYDVVWWVAAEEPGLIAEQFADLAAELGHPPAGAGNDAVRRAVLAGLRACGRWLLVFDNAENPRDIAGWLFSRDGHVLITSRTPGWTELAMPVEVDVLMREESVAILRGRVDGLTAPDAAELADGLGNLPLALAQAAAYLADTGMAATAYRKLLETQPAATLSKGQPVGYPRSLAAATQLSVSRLGREDPAAAELVNVCAFLGPEPVPGTLFARAREHLPAALADCVADPLAWADALARIGRSAIARVDRHGLQFHRLTQAVIRDSQVSDQAAAYRGFAGEILVANAPGHADDPASWPDWATLMPHLLAMDFTAVVRPELRTLACRATRYLLDRGSVLSSRDLAETLRRHWSGQLGPDDPFTLNAASNLAAALWHLNQWTAARELDEDTLERRRRVLGEDHPETLRSANNLASDLDALGQREAARDLFEATLERRRAILGDDHPDTLSSAHNLATERRAMGDAPGARVLFDDTLRRRRQVLGDDHPDTLRSASNLAGVLRELAETEAARDLDQDTLERRQRVLGEDHPDTLSSASNLASDLYDLGDWTAARDLDDDTLARYRQVLGGDHPVTLSVASNLAGDLRKLGEVAAARDLDQDTLERRRVVLGENHPDTLRSAQRLAQDD